MRTTIASYLDDFLPRGSDTAFAHRRGLRLRRWSYARVARTAYRFARELESRGVRKGDRILIWARNSPEWVASFFGSLVRGAIVVPLDAQSEPSFVMRVARQVEAKLAVLDDVSSGKVTLDCPVLPVEEFDSLLARLSASPVAPAEADRNDTVEILFTSGTTAEPKGVRITHHNLLVNLIPLETEMKRYHKYERLVHPIRFLNLLPLSHVFGQLMGVFIPQLIGGEVFFQESMKPSQIIETIKRERISALVAVPRILETLREKLERDYEAKGRLDRFHRAIEEARDRSPWRRWWTFRRIHAMFGVKFWAFISGGATLSRETEEFWDRLGFAVIQGYGMTETASLVTVNHPLKLALGSIGQVMPGQEVKLAADGEILVRGENVSPGYWKAAGGGGPSEDGWFRTGDIGEMDREGNLYFKGRKKEVIVTAAGMKVYPDDIEQVLDRQPEVRASAVVPIEGPGGPEPLAVLLLRDPETDPKAVIDRANGLLAQYQRVRRWYIWPEEDFPRTSTQKVRKGLVAERAIASVAGTQGERLAGVAGAGPAGAGPVPEGGAADLGAVDAIVSRVSAQGAEKRDPSATLGTDLKLDSLGRVELLGALEDRYQIELDEAALTEATTLGDIERMVREGEREKAVPFPHPRWQQRWPLGWLRIFFMYALIVPLTRVLGRPRISGAGHLRGVRGPLLFVCNHVTVVDHALVLLAVPGRFRNRMAIAMDGEVLRGLQHPEPAEKPLTRALHRLEYVLVVFFFNVFSMPKKSGFRRSFAFAGEMIDRGASVLVFPEGQHTEDGKMHGFKPGTGLLISELEVPVVPVRIDGLWELKVAKRRHARPGELSVHIGEPASYAAHDAPEWITADLEERMRRL